MVVWIPSQEFFGFCKLTCRMAETERIAETENNRTLMQAVNRGHPQYVASGWQVRGGTRSFFR